MVVIGWHALWVEKVFIEEDTEPLSFEVTSMLEDRIKAIRGGGQPLPASTHAFFEPRFGYDFSRVRLHTDNPAGETAQAVNARAFTVGRDIVFGAGQYALETHGGKALLAHKLTHVIPQTAPIEQSIPRSIQRNEEGERTTPRTGQLRRAEENFRTTANVPEGEYVWRIESILHRRGRHIDPSRSEGFSSGQSSLLLPQKSQNDMNHKTPSDLNDEIHKQRLGVNRHKGWENLRTRYGQVTCLPPFADVSHEIRIANCDRGCTRPSTQEHEETHVSDILDCCRRWRAAARPIFTSHSLDPGAVRRLYERWLDWLDANEDYFESRADWNQLTVLRRLQRERGCDRTTRANRSCCGRISRWITEVEQTQQAHHRASGPLSPCPWPAITGGGAPTILQIDTCEGVGGLRFVPLIHHDEHKSLMEAQQEPNLISSSQPVYSK